MDSSEDHDGFEAAEIAEHQVKILGERAQSFGQPLESFDLSNLLSFVGSRRDKRMSDDDQKGDLGVGGEEGKAAGEVCNFAHVKYWHQSPFD